MTHRLLHSVAAALAVSISVCAPAWAEPLDTRRIDALFESMPKDGPGCALGIYRRGEPLMLKGYGLANLEHGVPVGPDTVFNIGSVSKQFTAMSVIMLAEQGKLGLDDDIRKYLPEMPDYGTPITIRQMINHTSGVRNYFDVLFLKGLTHKDPATPDEVYALITALSKPDFPPGSQERYSNSGYFLLGRIVERVSGMSLAQFEQENIFGPLGMTHTHVHDNVDAVVAGRAYGYVRTPKGGFRTAGSQIAVTGDGGVFTTVRDLALWDADFYNGKVWRPAVKAEMLRIGKLTDSRPAATEPGVFQAGGLNIGERRGLKFITHGGKDIGFMADLTRYPEQQLTTALLCNQIFRIGEISDGLADLLLADHYAQPAVAEPPPAARAAPPAGAAVAATLLKEAPGEYYSREIDGRYTILAEGGSLVLQMGPHRVRVGPLQQFGENEIGVGRTRLSLHRDRAGRVVGFALEGFEFVKL